MLLQQVLRSTWHRRITDPSLLPQLKQRTTLIRSLRQSTSRQHPRSSAGNSAPAHMLPIADPLATGGSVPTKNVIKALIFTGAFSTGCFLGATMLEYENARQMMMSKGHFKKLLWFKRPSVGKSNEIGGSTWEQIKREVQTFWDRRSHGEKVFIPLCALNVLVFGMWRVPSLRKTMMTYFLSNPAARAVCWPMFLSTFSHYSAFHLAANMYVLHSFSNGAVMNMGKEQFLAVYLAAGVISSLASVLYKALTLQAGMSLGASGAIMAILAYVCVKYPDTQLSIILLPAITFSAGSAIKVIMGIDLAGCLFGWKFFDHAAHLGGAIFGMFWAFYGAKVWEQRIPFLSFYHDIRKTKSS